MDQKIKLEYKSLISSKNKMGQGFSFATTFLAPKDHESQFFIALDITTPNPKCQELVYQIIDAVSEGYNEAHEKPATSRFEEVIKILNEYLAEKFHDGEIFWLGQVNAVVAMQHKNKLHLTSCGKGVAFLVRDGNLIELSEGLAQESPDPVKTFANISGGNLSPADKLIFSTPGLAFHLSREQIKNILLTGDPFDNFDEIKNLLDTEENTLGTSLLLVGVNEDHTEALGLNFEAPAVPSAIEVKTKTPEENLSLPTPPAHVLPEENNIIETETPTDTANNLQANQENLETQESTTVPEAPQFAKEYNAEALKPEEPFADQNEVWTHPEEHEKEIKGALGKTWSTVTKNAHKAGHTIKHKIWPKIKSSSQKAVQSSVAQTSKEKAKGLFATIIEFIKDLPKKSPTQKMRYLKISIIVLVVFITSVFALSYQTKRAEKLAGYENTLKEARNEFSLAANAIIFGDNQEAKKHLDIAETLTNELKTIGYKKSEVAKLITSITEKKDQAAGIARISSLEITADLGQTSQNGSFSNFVKINNIYFIIDGTNNKMVQYDAEANTSKVLGEIDGGIVDAVAFGSSVYLLTDTKLFEFKPDTNTISEIKVSGGLAIEPGSALGNYKTFLYLLSPTKNQIFRYSKTLDGVSKPVSYIKTKDLDFSAGVDLSIPDFAYSLSKNGQILKFASGSKQKFEVTGMPDEITGAKRIIVIPEKNIYILEPEKERILVLDINGKYQKQYVSGDLKNASDISVDGASGIITVLGQTKLYNINQTTISEKP